MLRWASVLLAPPLEEAECVFLGLKDLLPICKDILVDDILKLTVQTKLSMGFRGVSILPSTFKERLSFLVTVEQDSPS